MKHHLYCLTALTLALLLALAAVPALAASNLKGDVNLDGQVTATDMLKLKQHLTGIQVLTGQALSNADMNGDGNVSATDITLLQKMLIALEPSICYPTSLFISQTPRQCTYASAAMMIRGIAYKNGWSGWDSVTESSVDSADGGQSGLSFSFQYYLNDHTISVAHQSTDGISIYSLKNLIDSHPEGIVLYCYTSSQMHAVFVTDYSGDTFYCADPQPSYSGTRMTLASSLLGSWYGSQSNILNMVTDYWYISSAQ